MPAVLIYPTDDAQAAPRHPLAAVALRPRASSVTHAIPTVRIDNAIDMVTILC